MVGGVRRPPPLYWYQQGQHVKLALTLTARKFLTPWSLTQLRKKSSSRQNKPDPPRSPDIG